jgi:trehalose 2-sulfotransferase
MERRELLGRVAELDPLELLAGRPKWAFAVDEGFARHLRETLGVGPDRLLPIATLGQTAAPAGRPALHEVAAICTEGAEDLPMAALRRMGIKPLRLFADLVLRRAARADLRGAAEVPPPLDLGYVILCLPRCGSTLLAKELELLGLGRPTEHLRASVVELLRAPAAASFDVRRWWTLVQANNTVGGVFGTKILIDFLLMAQEADPDAGRFLREAVGDLRVLRIIRRNKVDQAVSDHLARQTGVWHLWNDTTKAGYGERLAQVGDDIAGAAATWRKFVANEARLDRLLRENAITPIDIDYDALAADPKGVVKGVAEAMGRAVPDDYLTSPVSLEPTRTGTHARLAALLAAEVG